MIAERVLAGDVTDYVRFRAVCGSWRRCCANPRTQISGGDPVIDGRFLPRRWIMIETSSSPTAARHHRFLCFTTGECIHMDLQPELADHHLLMLTPEGLLLLSQKQSPHGVRLLNPLTRHLTDLPPFATALTPMDSQVRGVAAADDSTVAVYLVCPRRLLAAKPGDERWTLVDAGGYDHSLRLDSMLSFAGKIYCVSYSFSGIMTLDTTSSESESDQPPRILTTVEMPTTPFSLCTSRDSLHLVDNSGRELMVVLRTMRRVTDEERRRKKYTVYRVDLDGRQLIPVESLSGTAVFIGLSRSVSVSMNISPSISGDTLYVGCDCREKRTTHGYHVGDGSAESSESINYAWRFFNPYTLVDCLSWCIKDIGEHLLAVSSVNSLGWASDQNDSSDAPCPLT